MAKRNTRTTAAGELPEEVALRRLRARAESQMLRAAMKLSKAQMSTFAAAKVSRQTKDWRAPLMSADATIIDDTPRLNARARQLVRDSWIAKAAVRAKRRNVVGTGIIPIPAAHLNGVELTEFNNTLESLFWDWASDRNACDVEGRSTFWKMQSRAVAERFTVGEHFIVWSYTPNSQFVGLQLQGFEPEQLDDTIQGYGGNEVRRGIEVDSLGRAVAYHFFERTPNDYLTSKMKSIRIPAARVLHYFDSERAQQSHGVTEMAPVMMDIRDFSSFKDAMLFRAKMEACIGFIIKKTSNPIGSAAGINPATGDTTTLSGGDRAFDMAPGMVPELMPGEDVVPFMPASPGNSYEPFTETTVRGIGAGTGLSYGAIARKSDSNYSAARQDMLEDERELAPEQDELIDVIIKPVFELFAAIAIGESRLPISPEVFNARRRIYLQAEYIPPARPWIDPEKEANAANSLIENRLITRKAIAAKMGYRQSRTISQIADERMQATAKGITFPEDVEAAAAAPAPAPSPAAGPVQPGQPAANGGTVNTEVNAESSLNGAQITAVLDVFARYAKGEVTAPVAVELLVAVGIPRDRAESMVKDQESAKPPEEPKPAAQMRARLAVIPNYRAATLLEMRCGTCRYLAGTTCSAYDEPVSTSFTCDAWECPPATAGAAESQGFIQPPGPAEGDKPFDQTSAREQV